MDARVGIEPTNKTFAESRLTTWLPRAVIIYLRYSIPNSKFYFDLYNPDYTFSHYLASCVFGHISCPRRFFSFYKKFYIPHLLKILIPLIDPEEPRKPPPFGVCQYYYFVAS